MPANYLKKAAKTSTDDAGDVRATVQAILNEIEGGAMPRRANTPPSSTATRATSS